MVGFYSMPLGVVLVVDRLMTFCVDAPKNPVVLAHGLFGFDTLRVAGRYLPGVQYWRGIREALSMKGVEVITATVPPSGSIEMRAEELANDIAAGARGKNVNIIAYVLVSLCYFLVFADSGKYTVIAW